MNTAPLSSIIVPPERQRQEFSDKGHATMIESIKQLGLISPIVLRQDPEGLILVAGERRLRACKVLANLGIAIRHAGEELEPGTIPYLHFGELTELQRREIEYAENAHREDLTWQENVKATEQLYQLRQLQLGATHTQRQIEDITASELVNTDLDSAKKWMREKLAVAANLDNPAINKATSVREAAKILRRIEDTARNVQLATLQGTRSISDRYQCFQAEAVAWMKGQPNAQFDCILTDPPYGMDADSFGDAGGRMADIEHDYEDTSEATRGLLSRCVPEWFRLAKPQAHLYVWCDIDMFTPLREMCRLAGWRVHRTPLINFKQDGGRFVPWAKFDGPRRSYELCLFAIKGDKPCTSIRSDIFESRMSEEHLGHGAQKPVESYVELLRRSCRPGDTVLDTFAGTGTIFPAAHALGLTATGVELEAAAYGICLKRIRGLK